MFYAEKYFELDSLKQALNGDGEHIGFLDVIDNYGMTDAANLAKYYTGIIYLKQHKFDDCIYKRKLKFDFYLPDYNMCIEYDGKQHFQIIEHFGGEKRLKETQIKDKIKTEYCINNNIQLIRIKYNQNIEYILKDKLFSLI